MQTFHDVHLEAASSSNSGGSAPKAATSIANENVAAMAATAAAAAAEDGGRGERVKEEIAMLSPMPQNPGEIKNRCFIVDTENYFLPQFLSQPGPHARERRCL